MQNNTTFKVFLKTTLLSLSFAFLAYASSVQAETPVVHTGTVRICSVLADTTHVLASADATVPVGTFSLSLATTKDFTSPLVTHTFNAQAFAHNTTIDGVAMHCTDALSVPFGQYYYNNITMSGAAWSPSQYFDSTSSFSVAAASLYTNGLFTADSSDDVLINTASDGLVVVDAVNPNRTVIVLNTFTPVLDTTTDAVDGVHNIPVVPAQCLAEQELIINGSFEHPKVTDSNKWTIMSFKDALLSWKSYDTSYGIEIQAGIIDGLSTWLAQDGVQYAEVDGGYTHDISQDVATVPSHTYTLSFWSSPRPHEDSSTNTMNVFANGMLLGSVQASTSPTVVWTKHTYSFTATSSVTRISFVDAKEISIGRSIFLDNVSLVCNPSIPAINHAPTITLVGVNPITLTTGGTFTDPGATATDIEDGNITSKIVVTGTVNTAVPGTYTLTYTVTDSGGLNSSVIRPVVVLPVAACVAHTNLISNGGFENPKLTILWGSFHLTTPDFFWTSYDTVVYPFVEVQAGYTEGSVQWLPHTGTQYAEIDGGTNHDVSQVLATIPGNTYTLSYWASPRPNLSTATNIMNISVNGQLIDTYSAEGSVMTDWSNRSYNFIATTTQTRVSFTQGQNAHPGEGVFLDDVSFVCNPSIPAINHAPIITLVGANPATLTVGQTWNEPGATATDIEDGNITSKIIITGTVDVNTPGTYTLTYTVTDSGGLSASTTRQVVVVVKPVVDLSCKITSQTQQGWYGTYFNYSSTTIGMENSPFTWDKSGDPLAFSSVFTMPWYDTVFARFSRVDNNLMFGESFFPFNSRPEELINGNEFHFGVRWEGYVYATSTKSYAFTIASDDDAWVYVNGVLVLDNAGLHTVDQTKSGAVVLNVGNNLVQVFFAERHTVQSALNFSFDDSSLIVKPYSVLCTQNTPPVITLVGANPATLTVGQTWNEPGATATDIEDGNITSKIVVTGTVNTAVPGTYTLTYTVTDSGGLSASTTRQVVVAGNPVSTGSITFCSIFANKDNVIATTSANLPFGTFAIKLGTTTDIANSTLHSKVWNASSFAPNRKVILSQNDADCVTYNNLPLGSYYYSELGVTGSQWIVSSTSPKYNDQLTAPVNNIFDLFAYSPELFTATTTDDASRNVNSDGLVVVSSDRRDHVVVLATKYADTLACMLPEITSASSATGEVGKSFSYTLSATSTATSVITYSASSLPAGLSLSGDTISGTPTVSGAFTVIVTASNSCGLTSKNIVITIAPAQDVCTTCGGGSGGGGGGGGGGNGPVVSSLTITNEKVVEITPGVALVTWNTNLPATKEVGYGNTSQPASFITAPFGYATSTVRVSSPLETIHSYTIPIQSGKSYYFRPVSSDSKTTVAGIELVLNPGTPSTGGTTAPNACYYLFDYLKQGWNNNPVEVKKLQVFLRDLEGFAVDVTGVYDNQTVSALNAFQNRYKDDILTPWGHTAPTSFTYITTKKKVNEIYCKTAFPVTVQQQAEIDAYKAFLQGLLEAGVTLGLPTEDQLNQPVIIDTSEVGVLPGLPTSTLGTLANGEMNATSTTAGRLTANVIASSKKIGNLAAAIFAWPWDWARGWFGGNDDNQCTNQSVFSSWFSWILIIIILTMSYLWYRERQENKKAEDINKELDLM